MSYGFLKVCLKNIFFGSGKRSYVLHRGEGGGQVETLVIKKKRKKQESTFFIPIHAYSLHSNVVFNILNGSRGCIQYYLLKRPPL